MAERTPKRRASYEAAATTPRSRSPPTATGLPRRSGLRRCSTDAKNASMSMWITLRGRSNACGGSEPGVGEGRSEAREAACADIVSVRRQGCLVLTLAAGHNLESRIRQRALELQ